MLERLPKFLREGTERIDFKSSGSLYSLPPYFYIRAKFEKSLDPLHHLEIFRLPDLLYSPGTEGGVTLDYPKPDPTALN